MKNIHFVFNNNNKKQVIFDEKFYLPEKYQAEGRDLFIKWYKKAAKDIITRRVMFYSLKTGIKFNRIRITSARKRWGSCTSKGNINFPWRLIMAPLEIIDYVVVHELAHIVYPNHSKKFWEKVEEIYPGHVKYKKWLKNNGHLLTI